MAAFSGRRPGQWGLDVEGVTSRLEQALGVALTFDACGGGNGGDGYDAALIDSLVSRAGAWLADVRRAVDAVVKRAA